MRAQGTYLEIPGAVRGILLGGGGTGAHGARAGQYYESVVECGMMSSVGAERGGGLGPLESEVMDILWDSGRPMTVREVLDRANRGRQEQLAYTTVMTVMSRLAEKAILRREREGRGYVYEPTADDRAAIAVRKVVREFGDAAMAHFVEEARGDPGALRRLRRLLERD